MRAVGSSDRTFDLVAVLLAVVAAATAVALGLQTGYSRVDVDEQVYRDTLLHMRAGESYYPAMRDSLVHDKRERPTAVRSLRPPTVFLLLRPLPPSSWRWVVGLVYLAVLLLAWRLGRAFGALGGAIAVVLAAIWVFGFADYLFLHAELWGLPFFMAGLVALRRGDDGRAAGLMAAATFFRELFGLGLVLGLVLRQRRRPWLLAIGVVAVGFVVHTVLAQSALSRHGHDAGFGNEHRTVRYLLGLVSPAGAPVAYAFGLLTLALALYGALRVRSLLPDARLAAVYAVVMIALSVYATRQYWTAVWAPALVAYAPAAIWPPSGRVG